MARHVALLRAINLGATNRVPMPALREALAEAGYEDVATVVQSGNVVLTAPAKGIGDDLRALVKERFGVDQPVMVRTATQWRKLIAANPLAVTDPKRFQIVFFAERVEPIDVGDIGREEVAFAGREIYCSHPDGMQRSKLARALGKLDGGTARNWNTVLKLEALL